MFFILVFGFSFLISHPTTGDTPALKMTLTPRKSKKKSSSTKSVLNLDNDDLLGFVNGLEDMDEKEDEEYNNKFETFADIEEEQKKKLKKVKNTKIALSSAGDADFDDFAAVLDVDDASFAGLKKRAALIKGYGNDNDEEYAETKKKRSVQVVEAPLPTAQQKQIDRTVAYDRTVKDVSKWTGIIQKNRDAEQLKFPLISQQASSNVSSHTMISTFEASTDLEKEISNLIQRDGISAVKTPQTENEDNENDLPTNHLNPDQLFQELAKIRSSKFFTEIRARRQAKIKSKKYRKILAKERMKAEAEAIAAGNLSELGKLGLFSGTAEDSEIRRERRMKAEMDRARERLTLRTRKVNKWANDLLNKRHGDADGRLRVLEQVREKERLRQQIYGIEDGKESENETSESESEEESENENESENESEIESENDNFEVQEIFDRVKEERSIITGRFKFTAEDQNENIENDDEDLEEEINESIIKKKSSSSSKVKFNTVKDDFSGDSDNENEADSNENVSKWQVQKNLIREAFEEDQVFEDFEAEKDAIVDSEAPKTIDVTLPGWGVWAGAGISEEDSKSKAKFVIHKKGIDPRARLDKDLKHVIINERRIKAAAKSFTIPKTPFPFTSAEMHARHISQPIGKEWNTVTSYKKRIQPKIVAKPGSIIKPIKFFKQSKHV